MPHAVADSLHRAGHFRAFPRPSAVVSPFPSLTGPSFAAIWGEEPRPGYEDLFFDREENALRGGILDHVLEPGAGGGFHRHVEFEMGGAAASLGYLVPEEAAAAELRGLRRGLDERLARDSVVVAYLTATDALGHRRGLDAVADHLVRIEGLMAEVRDDASGPVRFVLLSDHGSDGVPSRRARVERALREAGYRLARSVDEPRDVAIPRFGLVGSGFIYARPGEAASLAEAAVRAEGVEVAFHREGEARIRVVGPGGDARVEWRAGPGGDRYRYRPGSGDPLAYAAVAAELRRRGALADDGFAPGRRWLAATGDHPFPDALRRIVRALTVEVRNPATVALSLAPGFHFGSPVAGAVVEVAGTHGSLRRSSSRAFLWVEGGTPPSLLRADEVRRWLPVARPGASPDRPGGSRPP